MKKPQRSKPAKRRDALKAEYDFDYAKARPNRFASRAGKDCTVVVLDTDVSKVFSSSESVNTVLRALIAAIPRNTSCRPPARSVR
jgi:hypothetical protein